MRQMLKLEKINTFYGRTHMLRDVSLSIKVGEVVCLLGRQGSGKTTILKAIMGMTLIFSGKIEFSGEEITGKRPYEICRLGIGYVPQNKEIFPNLTVEQNLRVVEGRAGPAGGNMERIYTLFPDLKRIRSHYGLNLSGGEQQMLAIARGLMVNPKLILLDEPSIGLAPRMLENLRILLKELSRGKISIIMAEQNVRFAFSLASRGYVVDRGTVQSYSDYGQGFGAL